MTTAPGESLLSLLQDKLGPLVLCASIGVDQPEIEILRSSVSQVFPLLRDEPDLLFDMLLSVTVVDFSAAGELPFKRAEKERFQVVYHLLSLSHNRRLRVKAAVPAEDPRIDSLCFLWESANWMEREAWDMFGVVFTGHPDLRRILLYDEFEGHPLRKDYPLRKKQPRVKMRYPEVRNTSMDLSRPEIPRRAPGGGNE